MRLSVLLIAGLAGFWGCTPNERPATVLPPAVEARLATITREYPCPDTTRTRIVLLDSTAGARSCHLAGAVLHEIVSGGARAFSNLTPSDSALLEGVLLYLYHDNRLDVVAGETLKASTPDSWVLELVLRDRPEHYEARINILTGRVTVAPWEGGLASQSPWPYPVR